MNSHVRKWGNSPAIRIPLPLMAAARLSLVGLSGTPASVVLTDHVKSLDWRRRNAQFKSRAAVAELAHIRAKIAALIDL